MKYDLRKVIAMILVIVICAAAAVTGFAVSAAEHSHTTGSSQNGVRPALKDGVWKAVREDGVQLFFINESERSFSLIDPELGIGLPSRYEYNPDTGIYKLQIGYVGNEENWRVIDNSGRTATVSDADGDLITLYYISNEGIDSFSYYTLSELSEMARTYYESRNGSSDGVDFRADMLTDDTFYAAVTAEKDGVQLACYTVDLISGAGYDAQNNPVNLAAF